MFSNKRKKKSHSNLTHSLCGKDPWLSLQNQRARGSTSNLSNRDASRSFLPSPQGGTTVSGSCRSTVQTVDLNSRAAGGNQAGECKHQERFLMGLHCLEGQWERKGQVGGPQLISAVTAARLLKDKCYLVWGPVD